MAGILKRKIAQLSGSCPKVSKVFFKKDLKKSSTKINNQIPQILISKVQMFPKGGTEL